MRKMKHELHYLAMMRCKRPKKNRALIPDEGKYTSERTKKTRAFIPGRGSPYFVTSQGSCILEHGKKIGGVLRYGKWIRRYSEKR